MAPTPQTMGRTISNWPRPRGSSSTSSGGDSSNSSPRGSCGAGRRGGRRNTTVPKILVLPVADVDNASCPMGGRRRQPGRRVRTRHGRYSRLDTGNSRTLGGRQVAGSVSGGLSRVTIVAPKARVDLALPTNVTIASLLPTLLRYAGGDLADDGAAQGGWALSRLGGQLLDNSRTPAQLDVRDGELLYFTPR